MELPALPRILIADASANIVERLAASIDDVAQVVGRATSARDALILVRSTHPQLAVFDIALAKGLELLREIKSHQPRVIIAVLTHSAEDETRRLCLRLGADYFLDKNSEFNKVREIVLAISSGRAALL